MKAAAVLFATIGLACACACAGVASASAHVTDLDYLKANRCKGLAVGLGSGDTAGLDAMIKAEGRSRADAILLRGQEELARGKRDAAKADLKDRLTAELNGPCMAYMSSGKEMAGGH
jgi:hypothetical protein